MLGPKLSLSCNMMLPSSPSICHVNWGLKHVGQYTAFEKAVEDVVVRKFDWVCFPGLFPFGIDDGTSGIECRLCCCNIGEVSEKMCQSIELPSDWDVK